MQMYYLNRRLKNTEVTVNSVHPGIVENEITRKYYGQQMWITIFQLSKLLRNLNNKVLMLKNIVKIMMVTTFYNLLNS